MLRRLLVAAAAVAVLGGCGDDGESTSSRSTVSTASPVAPSPTTTVGPGDTTVGPGSEILRLDAPSEIDCTAASVDVVVAYSTRNLAAVGFAVDGIAVTGPAAPMSGTYTLALPCDGRVHTIMLIGSGPGGPVFGSEAVATRPA